MQKVGSTDTLLCRCPAKPLKMLVKSVKLQNFRCHEQYQIDCKKQTTLILGKNGCGKTSVLEAIYEVLRGKSFRATDREIIRRGTDFYRVELSFDDGEERTVTYNNQKQEKIFLVKGRKYRRLPANCHFPVVLFEFKDLDLVSASPSRQRDYFDEVLGLLYNTYKTTLRRYQQALKQRNQLIKQEVSNDQLIPWDILLAKYGCQLRRERQRYLESINQRLSNIYRSIAHNQDTIQINYQPYGLLEGQENAETQTIEYYLQRLQKSLSRDLIFGYTTYGAHRDQYQFLFNQRPAKGSASRGEIRSIMISLKFLEAADLEHKNQTKPLILLDDVFSELDKERRQCLVENFCDHQIILTSTEGY